MSRIVEISGAKICKPGQLERAIQTYEKLYGTILTVNFRRNNDGIATGGSISIPSNVTHAEILQRKARMSQAEIDRLERKFPGYFSAGQTFVKACVQLKFLGGRPQFNEAGELIEGEFQLTCDEDYPENFRLGRALMDCYLAETVRETLEAGGHTVEIIQGQDGITVDGYLTEETETIVSEY